MQRNPQYMAEMQEEVANAEYFREVNARERAEVAASIAKPKTPLTDTAADETDVTDEGCAEFRYVSADFARSMERETITQAATITSLNAYAEKVEGQRDELLVALKALRAWVADEKMIPTLDAQVAAAIAKVTP